MFNVRFFENQVYYLSGAGVVIGDNSVVIENLVDLYGNLVDMTYFGVKGWFSIEQGTPNERQQSFTGITQNGNGTATLTGIKTVFIAFPYTETANFDATHAGGTSIVFSNNPGLYDTFSNKQNSGTIIAPWVFNAFANNANPKIDSNSYVFQPLDYITTGGVSSLIINGTFDYFVDTGAVNAIVITPVPPLLIYSAGQHFFIKVANTNTGATTINVNGLGVKSLKKEATVDLSPGDILSGEIILVSYDGTNFQLIGSGGGSNGGSGVVTRSTIGSFTLAPGVTALIDTQGTSGAIAGNVMTSAGSISNLYINSGSNTLDGSTVYTLLKNGSPTTVTVTVGATTNGIFHDTTHSFSVVGGDLITLKCDTTASTINSGLVSFSYQVGSSGSSIPVNPSIQSFIFEDFIGGTNTTLSTEGIGELGWTTATNCFIQTSNNNSTNHPGTIKWESNGVNQSPMYLASEIGDISSPNSTYEFDIQLASATDTFFCGIKNNVTTDLSGANTGLGISNIGGNWSGIYNDGSGTVTIGSIAATTSWVKLTIITNAGGTSAEFFVDEVSLGTIAIALVGADGFILMSGFGSAPTTAYLADYALFNRVLTR